MPTSRSWPVSLLLLAGISVAVASAPAAETRWDGEWTSDNLPQDSHPTWQYFGGPTVEALDNALVIRSEVETSTAGFRLLPDEQAWHPQDAKAVELEVALKVVAQDGDYANLLNLWGFGEEGNTYWSIKFRAAGLQVNSGPLVAWDMGQASVFRIVATADRLEIFPGNADEPLMISESPLDAESDPGAAGLSTIDFGDTSGTAGGVVEWQFLRWRTER